MIDIHPQSENETLVVTATGILNARDYEVDFLPHMEKLIETHGKVNLVMYLDPLFEGWEFGAMWDDARFGLRHRHDFKRIAVVGAQPWFKWAMQIGSLVMDGQFKTFGDDQLDEAIAWTKANQPAETVTSA